MFGRVLKWGAATIAFASAGLVLFLVVSPPDLLKVATNYSAKMICSNVFIAGRDGQDVLAVDVQAPGHPLLKFVSADVDEASMRVETRMFGFIAPATSQFRPGLGCTNLHQTTLSEQPAVTPEQYQAALWPIGNDIDPSENAALDAVLSDDELLGAGYRAVVVVHKGRIVAERYGSGFTAEMPLLGWSITKTVTAGLIGTLIKTGTLDLDDTLTGSYPAWATDNRADLTLTDLMSMSSGLNWNEGYGSVSDVTAMLYLTDDMASFASGQKALAPIGDTFNYSSGTSTMLSRAWQDSVGEDSLRYPHDALFGPLGMATAVMETDATDTFVGSSYMYATARDWAKYGLFLLQGGEWNDEQLLPEGYTDWMFAANQAPDNEYGQGHIWRSAPGGAPVFEDSVWMRGHDGQSIGIFPSRDLVVVRLGLTPSKLNYSPLPLSQAVIEALGN